MTTKNVAACNMFGNDQGFINSLTAFARGADPALTALEEDNDAISYLMEFENNLHTHVEATPGGGTSRGDGGEGPPRGFTVASSRPSQGIES